MERPEEPESALLKRMLAFMDTFIIKPTTIFREKIVEPNRKEYPWYHRQFRRVPEIDECYTDDVKCIFEADEQYKRDRLVEEEIIEILRRRWNHCNIYENTDKAITCKEVKDDYDTACTNFFIKYGDMGITGDVRRAFMKQKHRLVWERRHGPVGSGASVEENRKLEALKQQREQKELTGARDWHSSDPMRHRRENEG